MAKKTQIIITTSGMDGACSAALLLINNPESRLYTTSVTRLESTFQEILFAGKEIESIHLCGVGIDDNAVKVGELLAKIKELGIKIIWYCGRGYLNKYKDLLAEFCDPKFKKCVTNTEAVSKTIADIDEDTAFRLCELAEEYIKNDEAEMQRENIFWHKLVSNASAKFFRFGDEEAYPSAIKKLAGLLPVTEEDRDEVEIVNLSDNVKLPTGSSPQMKELRKNISKAAPHNEPVLILGPSGAGKELIAHSVHDGSKRAGHPFIPINCATLASSSELAHDRLFGHVKGAFTGAEKSREGAFEVADKGTLFLDEVAELPLEVQTSLLRVLEEGIISPMGSMDTIKVDVRIIAATNQDIPAMIERGDFRLDLFYRLNILSLTVPPLKDRPEDMKSIVANVRHTLRRTGHDIEISKKGWDAIYSYEWPGNIRQFINILKRSAIMEMPVEDVLKQEFLLNLSSEQPASKVDLPEDIKIFCPAGPADIVPEEMVRKAYVKRAYELMGRNLSETAKVLQMSRNTLKKWLGE
ncbi:MAG: sigma 54-interacting transcriptional regulator [Planctomycetota bacterium]|jgi:transcriptional regulator with PAS, ATPase and Fis domain